MTIFDHIAAGPTLLSATQMSALLLAAFLAAMVRAMTGFGSAIAATAILVTLGWQLASAAPIVIALEVANSLIFMLCWPRASITACHWREWWLIVLSGAVGTIIGLAAFNAIPESIVTLTLGVTTILFGLYALRPTATPAVPHRWWGVVAGIAGGITGSICTASGPPFMMYLAKRLPEKATLWATLTMIFLADYIFRSVSFAVDGKMGWGTLGTVLALVPVVLAGGIGGRIIYRHLSEQRFRTVNNWLLVGAGVFICLRDWLWT